jgi:hypothetical protein
MLYEKAYYSVCFSVSDGRRFCCFVSMYFIARLARSKAGNRRNKPKL